MVKVHISAGNGGHGAVSFRREKYIPAGGPDGGDGGRGGNIIFETKPGMRTLLDFKYQRHYRAENGHNGAGNNKTGRDGKGLVLGVPVGTMVRDAKEGFLIADLTKPGQRLVAAEGGDGGRGNARFKSSTRQAPTFAERGYDGEEKHLILELKLLADVGIIGFPNVGKSTILSVVTGARPKIANYPFTTLTPNLGVVELTGGRNFVLADIPGLIEGAHDGMGLGHGFLRHIERTRLLIHVLDVSGSEGRDPIEDFYQVNHELREYSDELAKMPQIVAANKMDLPDAKENIAEVRTKLEAEGIEIFEVSAATNTGLQDLMDRAFEMLDSLNKERVSGEDRDIGPVRGIRRYRFRPEDAFSVKKAGDGSFVVEGKWIDRLMAGVNIDKEESLKYFHRALRRRGVIARLKELGMKEGDTVKIGQREFEHIE